MGDPRTIVFFCMPEPGHFFAMRALIARFAARGFLVCVFTHRSFEKQVHACSGRFMDLFEKYPMELADGESRPIPCRFVTFAGHYARPIIEDVRSLNPSLIVYDTFAVVGPVVARALHVPCVSVIAGHNLNPHRILASLKNDPRVAVSPRCHAAVNTLRDEFGMTDATPFSYVTSLSPLLNICCEPPGFLSPEDRAVFEPAAFFGCLPDPPPPSSTPTERFFDFNQESQDGLKVYVSFGTVIWRYFAAEAAAALKAIADACAETSSVRAVISLAGVQLDPALIASFKNSRVRVVDWIDQSEVLGQADLFITHHGLNSTHEALFNRVPMVSYPFFWDQPALAAKCRELGVAISLTKTLRGAVQIDDVKAAFSTFLSARETFAANLSLVREWEIEVMEQRDGVIRRMEDLIRA